MPTSGGMVIQEKSFMNLTTYLPQLLSLPFLKHNPRYPGSLPKICISVTSELNQQISAVNEVRPSAVSVRAHSLLNYNTERSASPLFFFFASAKE